MKIKMRVPMSGPAGTHHAGAILSTDGKTLTEAAARELVSKGFAEEIKAKPAAADEKPKDEPKKEKPSK